VMRDRPDFRQIDPRSGSASQNKVSAKLGLVQAPTANTSRRHQRKNDGGGIQIQPTK
jgi:hypothetical protein